MKFIFVTQLNL